MVAYSFKARFAPAIISGTKRQTVRADRKRHARKGEMLQLFTGMRTKHCRKIVEVKCRVVDDIRIRVSKTAIDEIWIGRYPCITGLPLDLFARRDGFRDSADMHAFWLAEHGEGLFEGVVIGW